jgi:hypothetical protein
MLLNKKNYLDSIENLIRNSTELSIAVAFWGVGAEELLSNKSPEKTRIICNLSMGGTNPEIIENLIKMGFKVHQLNTLHAKIVISSNEVIIGSANISTNGLSLSADEISGWDEIGISSKDLNLIKQSHIVFSDLWEKSQEITNHDLNEAQRIWNKRRSQRPIKASEKSFFERDLTELKDRNIRILIWRNQATERANAEFKEYKQSDELKNLNTKKIDFFQNLDRLPKETSIISVYFGRRGSIKVSASFRRCPELDFTFDGPEGNLQIALREKTVDGFQFTKKDEEKLIEIIKSQPQNFMQNSDEIDILTIEEFIQKANLKCN